ncbi:MAG: hypothetical protein J6N19_18045 [Clostridium sp.]|nr:hypothetical protein [Clostridium sp.]
MKKDYVSADGSFFDDMRAKERKILEELGDEEALKILDEEEAAARKEYEEEEKNDTP